MPSDGPRQPRPADGLDPTWQLVQDLPEPWRGPVIGPDIPGWETAPGEDEKKIILTGLPDPFPAEMAWMAHWQEVVDGTPATVQPINQLALVLRHARRHHHPFPASVRAMDADTADRLLGWYYATRWRRLPPAHTRGRLRAVFRVARLALVARCHDGHWWELDDWYPRCDPRVPVSAREPRTSRISPGRISHPWLRAAVKWHLGTRLEAGTLRWSTIGQARQLIRLDRWLTVAFTNPLDVLSDPGSAAAHAAAFRRWAADPTN